MDRNCTYFCISFNHFQFVCVPVPTKRARTVASTVLAAGTVGLRLPRHLDFQGVEIVVDGLTLLLAVPGLADLVPAITTALSGVVILLGLWIVVPTALPSVYRPTRPGFRAIVTCLSAGFVPLVRWGTHSWTRSTALMLFGAWTTVALISMIGYHRLSGPLLVEGCQFRAPQDRFYRLSRTGNFQYPPQIPHMDANAPRTKRVAVKTLAIFGNAAVYALPCLFLGGIVASTLILEPLFELMLVLFVFGQVVVTVSPSRTQNSLKRIATVEDRFYETVQRTIDVGGSQGFVAVLLSLWGFANMAGLAIGTEELLKRFATFPPTTVLGWTLLLSGLTATLYGIWYWSRQFARLPDALSAWQLAMENEKSLREIITADGITDSPGPITRPVDYGFGPIWTLYIVFVAIRTFPAVLAVRPEILLIGYLLLTLVTLATVIVTIQKDPQPALTDIVAIPGALALQTLMLSGILAYARLVGPLTVLYVVMGVILLPAVYALPTLRRTISLETTTPGTVAYVSIGLLGFVLWQSVDAAPSVFLGLVVVGFGAGVLEHLLT